MSVAGKRVGIQSVEVGFPLLEVLGRTDRPLALSKLSKAAGLSASKAHRYLASYIRVGLVEQNEATGLYDLGPKALVLGLGALRRLDVLTNAEPIMADLRDQLDASVSLCVWSAGRPTIVRAVTSSQPVQVRGVVGSQLPLLTSAVGRVFLAWRSDPEVEILIQAELGTKAASRAGLTTRIEVENLRRAILERGVAQEKGFFFPGLSAIAAPVFDHFDTIAAALVCVGPEHAFMASHESRATAALIDAARAVSARMGAKTKFDLRNPAQIIPQW